MRLVIVRIASLAFACDRLSRNKKPFQMHILEGSWLQASYLQALLTLPDVGEFFRAFGGEEIHIHGPQDNTASWGCQELL
jgi:hypothetical protein